ncbi:MAG TPA: hypothetical protein VGQ32_00695 [Thermoanaerobaculia bacterium]|jgi:hypothetical protein|nr:hypothetical protein [Thermoanaerobaculia bacterium]
MKAPEKKVQKAVDREMPGYVVRKNAKKARQPAASTDAVSPDLETLKKKYLGEGSGTDAARTPRSPSRSKARAKPRYDDEIVPVEPKDRSRDGRLPGGTRAKRVVYSGDADEIIGRQG